MLISGQEYWSGSELFERPHRSRFPGGKRGQAPPKKTPNKRDPSRNPVKDHFTRISTPIFHNEGQGCGVLFVGGPVEGGPFWCKREPVDENPSLGPDQQLPTTSPMQQEPSRFAQIDPKLFTIGRQQPERQVVFAPGGDGTWVELPHFPRALHPVPTNTRAKAMAPCRKFWVQKQSLVDVGRGAKKTDFGS